MVVIKVARLAFRDRQQQDNLGVKIRRQEHDDERRKDDRDQVPASHTVLHRQAEQLLRRLLHSTLWAVSIYDGLCPSKRSLMRRVVAARLCLLIFLEDHGFIVRFHLHYSVYSYN